MEKTRLAVTKDAHKLVREMAKERGMLIEALVERLIRKEYESTRKATASKLANKK